MNRTTLQKWISCVIRWAMILSWISGSAIHAIEKNGGDDGKQIYSLRLGFGSGINFGGTPGLNCELILMKYLGAFAGVGIHLQPRIVGFSIGLHAYPLGTTDDLQPRVGLLLGRDDKGKLKGLICLGLQWNWADQWFSSFDVFLCAINRGGADIDYRSGENWAVGWGIHYKLL